MADTKSEMQTNRSRNQPEGERSLTRQPGSSALHRWDPAFGAFASPFELMDRMTQEMDRWFDRITRRSGLARTTAAPHMLGSRGREGVWFPQVETFQRGDTFVVRADLPGLTKDDVEVDLTDDAITIRGERREEHQEERENYWRTEREYGQFHRTIPLPDGVIGESAKATFRNGVLEIALKAAPPEANRGRKLEIQDASQSEPQK